MTPKETLRPIRKHKKISIPSSILAITVAALGIYDVATKQAGNNNIGEVLKPGAAEPKKPFGDQLGVTLIPTSTPTPDSAYNQSLVQDAIKTWKTEEGEKIEVPQIVGLTPKLQKLRGNETVVYFTNDDNPYGLKEGIPVGLFDPDIYPITPPGTNPEGIKKIGGVGLKPEVASYLHIDQKLSDIGITFLIKSDITANIDNWHQSLSQKPELEINSATDQAANIDTLFEPKILEGIEIYGGLKPITKEQLPLLIQYINSKQSQKEAGTRYESLIALKEVYDLFPYDNYREYMESFLARHAVALEEMNSKEGPQNRIKFRRIILLESSNEGNPSPDNLGKLNDSDNVRYWNTLYTPTSPDYDINTKIDYGFLYELLADFQNLKAK